MPLPKPKPTEAQGEFVSRCVVDFTMLREYPDPKQRQAVCYSLYEQQTVIKKVKANWAREWATNLDAAERYAATEVRKFYDSQAAIALDIFKRKGTIGADDVQFLYNAGDFTKLYEGIYESIGLRFAKWYAQNFDKLIKKGVNPSGLVEPWRAYFKLVGASVAAERVSLVQGTARQNLIDVTRRLSTDDVFINEGAEVRARMVRQKFNQYSQYQAERLVRTEATNIANIATEKAAEDIFAGVDMQKEWISAGDDRTRRFANKDYADHVFMDGKVVDFDKPFEVPTKRGIELLMRPGATNGSPGNVINCRCSMAPFPKEGAQAITEITDIGFGVADTLTAEGLSQLGTTVQTAVQAAVVEGNIVASKPANAVDDLAARKEAMRPDAWDLVVKENQKVNDEFLALLKTKPRIGIGEKSHQIGNYVQIDTKRHGKDTINKILAHEFGHLIHEQHKWCLPDYGKSNEIVSKFYKSQRDKLGLNSRSGDKYAAFKGFDGFSMLHRATVRSQFTELTDSQFIESYGAMADYFGAMTKNAVGWGHGNSYYSNLSWRHAEMLAHAFENKYAGNPVFKHFFPEIYDDTIKWLDELIATIDG